MSEESVSVTEGIEEFLSSGDRSLEVLFGSQSGNAEGLAAKFAKTAKSYGLEDRSMTWTDSTSIPYRQRRE